MEFFFFFFEIAFVVRDDILFGVDFPPKKCFFFSSVCSPRRLHRQDDVLFGFFWVFFSVQVLLCQHCGRSLYRFCFFMKIGTSGAFFVLVRGVMFVKGDEPREAYQPCTYYGEHKLVFTVI